MSKILIVEDDLVFARALKNWLEKEHFQVEYATNAARAAANAKIDFFMICNELKWFE